jgi:hypothetical protein
MGPHRYFVQISDKTAGVYVQEVEPKLFGWIQKLPPMDTAVNEPNLLQLERYPALGLVQATQEVQTFYAGVGKMSDNSMIMQFHYFLVLKQTKLRNSKKKPYLIKDYAEILNQKALNGDSPVKR